MMPGMSEQRVEIPEVVDVETPTDVVDEASSGESVEQPAKVMRIGSMIRQLLEEVRQAPLDDASRNRLKEIYETSVRELAEGLSPELRDELARLALPFEQETPTDAELRIDYNQGMVTHDAIRQLRDVETFKPTFIEQPVPGHHRAALAEITRALDTPVLADESVFTPTDALLVASQRMADLVSIKIMKHGGMLAGRKVAA